jgi:shingomyelin synthase
MYLNAFIGVLLVLLSHVHYTIDVIIAYYVTTRLFWIVHTLTNDSVLMVSSSIV